MLAENAQETRDTVAKPVAPKLPVEKKPVPAEMYFN